MKKEGINMVLYNKRGIAIWMSWVLLIAFMVALSAFMNQWITGYSRSTAEDIETTYDEESCTRVALDISGCQESEKLNIEVENNGDLSIDKIIFRLYDLYSEVESKEKEVDIKAGKTKYVEVLKQGTIHMVESIPVLVSDDAVTVCRNKMHVLEDIETC
ncbi:hypothetical protein DRJ17_06535 [Candidatus Woesearchaeota archaeon]|nr:MAG: hypothetical protein DRJ17_06535 [Candidatus Woesearchaeota archaeon]